MEKKPDIVIINPGDRKQVFQELGQSHAAIEPPYWVAVIAAYLRNEGFDIALIDADAENISPEETAVRVAEMDPVLTAVIVHGSTPSSSTLNMTVAGRICRAVKEACASKVVISGNHPTALPQRTMAEESVDYVIEGEGPLTLKLLLEELESPRGDLSNVHGLWYRENGHLGSNPRAPLMKDLDTMLPAAAWDLLPMDRYRSHFWHSFDDLDRTSPYVSLYTSLGCPYNCSFCCVNTLFGKPGTRYRSPESVVNEIGNLVEKYAVRNIKIADELFIFDEKHYMRIVDLLNRRGYDLNIWAWARLDSIKYENLEKMKKAGINWLVLGIESANAVVRKGVNKKLHVKDIIRIVRAIQSFDISICSNYIFGLPDDTHDTMQESLDQALELNTEMANFYSAMAYPGSKLYDTALAEGWELPKEWHGYSQHSYETTPLPTKYLSPAEVLQFRDDAFNQYFTSGNYLDLIGEKYGNQARDYVVDVTKVKLRRKLLET